MSSRLCLRKVDAYIDRNFYEGGGFPLVPEPDGWSSLGRLELLSSLWVWLP
jgi:hypothetical protein